MIKYFLSVLILLFVFIGVQFATASTEVPDNCNLNDYKKPTHKLAKVAWSQPKGPSKGQWKIYSRYLACAEFPDSLKKIWRKQAKDLKSTRILGRLSDKCKHHTVLKCIVYAATRYGQDVNKAKAVAYCESTYNRYASNGTHFGLFQFDSSTWAGSPFDTKGSVYSARLNSLAAMWYWQRGEYSRWVCY